jgi:very-short-patch-repair endonuclease
MVNGAAAKRPIPAPESAEAASLRLRRQLQVGSIYPDFLCRELDLIVECDGMSHDREPERDERRDAWLRGQGYTVLRFTNADVLGNLEGVVKAIALNVEALRQDRPTPNPSRRREGGARP